MQKSKSKKGPVDFTMFATIMLLIAIGVVMVYSASSYTSLFEPNIKDSMYYLKKQGLWAIMGFIAMLFTMNIDYHKYKKYTVILIFGAVLLLFAVFLFPPINGAQRWIRLGPASFQPSEIAKYVVVLYLAKSLEHKGEKVKSFLYGIIPYLMVSGFFAALILKEKNLSIASVIMIVTFIMLFVAGGNLFHLFGIVAPGMVSLAYIFIRFEDYRYKRFISFLNPWADPKDTGYQLIQSFLALGSGGVWGVGIGKSRQKAFYIPEPHNDFIFAIIGEELGLIGCLFIMALFLVFIWRGISTSLKAKDTYGSLLAIGITSVVAVQAIINIAVVIGSMPVTGVPLPFISYGGSSLIFNMIAMGVLLNISRQTTIRNK